MPLVDQFGQPYAKPPKPLDVAASVGVSHPATSWASVASSLTPARAATVIRNARVGNADAYLTLAEEIEERDLHYASVLQTRKFAISGVEPEIIPGDESALAETIAEEFRLQVAESDLFADLLFDLMDALAKGYSVVQPLWDTSEKQWNYRGFEWCDPRLFTFDQATLREIRLKDPAYADGRPMPPGQFVVHYPKIKTGIKIRGGLAMLATIAHVAKSYTLADWLAFCEVYGMPLRIAKYDPLTMTQPEIDQLKIALANVGHDAAALIPNGSSIEILDARRPSASGKNVFEGLANYWDAQLSKAVLGQTMTTDDGASLAQAQVHEGVRVDLKKADARSLHSTIRRAIIAPWVFFNYGDKAPIPKIKLPVEPPEDTKLFTEGALPWVQHAGLRVKASEIRAKFGLSAPDDSEEDEVLEVDNTPAPAAPPPGAPGAKPPVAQPAA